MSWQLDRRRFLRGAMGPLLPLPFLNLMERKASGAATSGPPIRFMTLFKPNGVHPPSWSINGGTEFAFRMSPLMQPFAKHKQDLLILDNMGDFTYPHAEETFLQHKGKIDELLKTTKFQKKKKIWHVFSKWNRTLHIRSPKRL